MEPYDFSKLPVESCAYCGIHDPKTIVQCKAKSCNKWFCNGKGTNEFGSHALCHMVKAHHKEVVVHPESELKESPLECYLCGSKNMFLLGFISAKTEYCVILVCREPCLAQISQQDSNFDTTNWMPLIENKAIVKWLVNEPSLEEMKRARQITP
jgi:regulator of nonsense transcripts 1